VDAFTLRVLPETGGVRYTLTVAASSFDFSGAFLVVGGMDAAADSSVQLSVFDGAGQRAALPLLLGTAAWDPGFGALDRPLLWDDAAGILTPQSAGAGETGFAFFRLPETGVGSIEIRYDAAASSVFGDGIYAGVGRFEIPEPGAAAQMLAAAASLLLAGRRR
jgi:hypothetical protein